MPAVDGSAEARGWTGRAGGGGAVGRGGPLAGGAGAPRTAAGLDSPVEPAAPVGASDARGESPAKPAAAGAAPCSEAGGADVILDIVGGPYIARNIKAAAPGATIVQLAFAQGSKVEIDLMPVMLKRLKLTGSTLRSRSDASKAEIAAQLVRHVWPLFADGRVKPLTGTVLPMSEARAAHELMQSAGHVGKILLVPDSRMASGEQA